MLRRQRVRALSFAPLVVTAHIDAASFAILNGMRQRHFPADLNKVPAHISLFHHLPGDFELDIVDALSTLCRGRVPFGLVAEGWTNLGRGVAARYNSVELDRLHRQLSLEWQHWLTAQDRQPLRPHVTIQNKVAPSVARALLQGIQHEPPPPCRVDGVSVWRYLGGPWQIVADCLFAGGGQNGVITS